MSFARFIAAVCLSINILYPLNASLAFDAGVMASVVSVLPKWPQSSGSEGRPKDPEGSGIAIFDGGFIATADHVIGQATEIDVRLADGRRVAAALIGRDPASDVALLKIDVDLLVPMFNETPALGMPVCAVGNPFGLGLSVSCGVVSAVHRTGTGFNSFEDFIQTDAAINPGGSGGGLFSDDGSLIGMGSAIFTNAGDGNIGVNFASSTRLVLRVASDLRDYGRVKRARSGMVVAPLSSQATHMGPGVRISRIRKASAAEQAGLLVGDIVTMISDRVMQKPSDVTGAIFLHKPGSTVDLKIVRNGAEIDVRLKLLP